MQELAKKAKAASLKLMNITHLQRKEILMSIANLLSDRKTDIIAANQVDLDNAKSLNLNTAMIDRLKLDSCRIDGMINGVIEIANQTDVVNEFFDEHTRDDGLVIKKQRIPLGVILMIFESRPNVVIDCAALAIKSSNAIILKGGKEAKASNEILGSIVQDAIETYIPRETIQTIASDKRELIDELLTLNQYIDVVIPRGGEKLIRHIYDHSKIPVIAHFQGLCHIYIDEDANLEKALKIIINAKTQRPGVCNTMETLIIHEKTLPFLNKILNAFTEAKTEVRLDSAILKQFENLKYVEATEVDWDTEYLENIISIKLVKSLSEAITHIQKYGSHHSEAIITESQENATFFTNSIDASCILHNASTRFNDGGELGLGAELGISTTKIHAYGPMGAKEMTTSRFVVIGDGHTRS